jgi:hypothetical protein
MKATNLGELGVGMGRRAFLFQIIYILKIIFLKIIILNN